MVDSDYPRDGDLHRAKDDTGLPDRGVVYGMGRSLPAVPEGTDSFAGGPDAPSELVASPVVAGVADHYRLRGYHSSVTACSVSKPSQSSAVRSMVHPSAGNFDRIHRLSASSMDTANRYRVAGFLALDGAGVCNQPYLDRATGTVLTHLRRENDRMVLMKRTAFTVLELLIVIVIILLIAALMFPVFSSVRKRARETSCINNLRQIYAAWSLYTSDHDGTPP